MKKFFKILVWTILVIVILLVTVPYLFKGQIFEIVKTEINNTVNAKVEFADFKLNLITSFPNLKVSLEELSVVGLNEFENDTLVAFDEFSVKADLLSVIAGNQIKVTGILLDHPRMNAKVLEDGMANWDIMKATEEVEEEVDTTTSEPSGFNIGLKSFEIRNLDLVYDDKQGNVYAEITDLNYFLKGDFTESTTDLSTNLSIAGLSAKADGIKYLNEANISFDAIVGADLDNMKFEFKDNLFKINELAFAFEGVFAMLEEAYDMDIVFDFKETQFKDLLSFVPAIYMADFQELQTAGSLALNGFVKGQYADSIIPQFDVNVMVERAMFKYPDLPKSVDNINVDVKLSNQTGKEDDTKIDINTFHFELGENPFDIEVHLATPISDPYIKSMMKGKINFETLADVIPLEGSTLKGILNTNLTIDGNLSTIEAEDYENFNAKGFIELRAFQFVTPDFPHPINIQQTWFSFSPKALDLKAFDASIAQSDFHLDGIITNYIPFALNDETLVGEFNFNSSLINVNEFMSDEEVEEELVEETDTVPMELIEIPKNLDLKLMSDLKKIKYDNLVIDNINGLIIIKEGKADLNQLKMDLLDGSLLITGYYSTEDIAKPEINFDMNIDKFDITKTYETFNTVKALAPGAKNAKGKFSSQMTIKSNLDQKMEPVYNTVFGYGKIQTHSIRIEDSKLFKAIGTAMKSNKFENMEMSDADISFTIENGVIEIEPFETKIASAEALIGGTQGIDQTIHYDIDLSMPRSDFGGAANEMLNNLAGDMELGDKVNIGVDVTGTVTDPKVSLDLKDSGTSVKEAVTEKVTTAAKDEAKKILAQAKEKSDKVLADAQKAADNVKKTAKIAGDKLVEEAEKEGKELVRKAGSNPIKKRAAQEAEKKLVNKAKQKSEDLKKEADRKADNIMKAARTESDNIMKEAERKAQ
jgi:AsmA-like C-terminal region/AsmA family